MKKILLFTFLGVLSLSSFAQQKVYISDTLIGHYMKDGKIAGPLNNEGKYHKKTRRKKGQWTEYAVVTDFEYYHSEKKNEPTQRFATYLEKAEGRYTDGKRTGVWNFYLVEYGSLATRLYKTETYVVGEKSGPFTYLFRNGEKGIEGTYAAGKYNGPVRSFYLDGSKYGLRIYKEGKATGKHVYYFSDGTTKMVLFYLNDKKHGPQKTYYPGGVLKEEYNNKNGKTNGIYRFYYPSGKLWVEKVYRNDLLVNVTQLLDSEGNSLEIGTLKNGTGTLNFYNKQGKIYAVKTYKNGVKVRTERMN